MGADPQAQASIFEKSTCAYTEQNYRTNLSILEFGSSLEANEIPIFSNSSLSVNSYMFCCRQDGKHSHHIA